MMKIPWIHHTSNEQILWMADESRSLKETLRNRQKSWIGHVSRHDSLLKATEGRLQGKKITERPMLLDAIMQEDEENEINYAKLKKHMTGKLGITEQEPALGPKTPDWTEDKETEQGTVSGRRKAMYLVSRSRWNTGHSWRWTAILALSSCHVQ